MAGSPALPKTVQSPRPPVIVGGVGKRRTPALAARFAPEFNVAFQAPDDVPGLFDRVRAACTEATRDPATMTFSAAWTVCCGRDDAAVRRRAAAIGRSPEELRGRQLGGTPAEVVDRLSRLAEAGATRTYLQVLDLTDIDHLELIAAEVAPQLA